MQETIELIRYHHRTRNFAMEQRKRAHLSLLSFLRLQLGWSPELPEKDRISFAKQAIAIVSFGETHKGEPPEGYDDWASVIEAAIESRRPFVEIENYNTKEMERLAKTLPVWDAWAAETKGVGARSLAVIVGEAGDLSNYPKKGHLWKRMGLAVMDGLRQGGLPKGAGADAWIEHGYNPSRRSRIWQIGDSMVKCDGPYRKVYLARKEYEREQAVVRGLTVAPSAKIPKADADAYISDGHVHRRAQRYMEKMFLRDLWVAWRRAKRAVSHDETVKDLPAADEFEGKAIECVSHYETKGLAPTPQLIAAE